MMIPNFFLGVSQLPSQTGMSVGEQLTGLAGIMGVRRFAFFVSDGQNLYLESADAETLAEFSPGAQTPHTIPLTNSLVALLRSETQARRWAELWTQVEPAEQAIWQAFIWADLLVPLQVETAEVYALLALGTRDPNYTPFDVELIQVAAEQMVLLDSHSALRSLARVMVVENDLHRRGTANLLHDNLLQMIFVIKANLKTLRTLIGDVGPAETPFEELAALLSEAVEEIRALIRTQQPVILERGLTFGLASLVESLRENGAPVRFETTVQTADLSGLRMEQSLGLFKIAEEALVNAVQHSGARAIVARLVRTSEAVQVSVTDDGCGFSGAFKADRPGVVWMRERAHILGAEFAIETELEAGTRVWVSLADGQAAQAVTA